MPLRVEPEVQRVLPHERAREQATGQHLDAVLLERLQEADADLRGFRDVAQADATQLALPLSFSPNEACLGSPLHSRRREVTGSPERDSMRTARRCQSYVLSRRGFERLPPAAAAAGRAGASAPAASATRARSRGTSELIRWRANGSGVRGWSTSASRTA